MNMRDLQSPTGVWFPTGMDAVGVESWAIKVPAKVVKDEVKWQLGRWKAELELAKRDASKIPLPDWFWGRYLQGVFDEDHPRIAPFRIKARVSICETSIDLWQKWSTYLANMPDDEALSLTKKDYEFFFADRDQREGKA